MIVGPLVLCPSISVSAKLGNQVGLAEKCTEVILNLCLKLYHNCQWLSGQNAMADRYHETPA